MNTIWRQSICLVSLMLCLAFQPFQSVAVAYAPTFDAEEQENISVYERASRAVVTINALVRGNPSSGAGVLIDSSGLVLTSSHVIGDATQVMVSLSDGQDLPGVIVGRMSTKPDLALLKISSSKPLTALPLADSTKLKVGQKVLAVGNPYGFERTLTVGIISRIDPKRNLLQTDAAINPGNSGGPLLDTQGYIVGINQSIFNADGNRSNIGIAFAVPINDAKGFLRDLATERPIPATVAAISRKPLVRYTPTLRRGYENVSMLLRQFSARY